MRIIIFLCIFLCGCSSCPLESGFIKLPFTDLTSTNSLIEKIKPDKNYVYWECVWSFTPVDNKVICRVGDTSFHSKITKTTPPDFGFFVECQPASCYRYIGYIEDGSVKFVQNKNELRLFIGKIDNIEEAMLIASINDGDLGFDLGDRRGNGYKITKHGFEMYLVRYNHCPITKESVKVWIGNDGSFKSETKCVYYKSKKCEQS